MAQELRHGPICHYSAFALDDHTTSTICEAPGILMNCYRAEAASPVMWTRNASATPAWSLEPLMST